MPMLAGVRTSDASERIVTRLHEEIVSIHRFTKEMEQGLMKE